MKKALQLASVASMIDQFNIPNIKILQSMGYQVDVVADFTNPGTITVERAENLKERLAEMSVRVFDIAIPRTLNPNAIISAYKEVKKLLDRENYALLHCHSPIGGVIARQVAKSKRKYGLKVIYTAHGFHFYDGAPLKNWLIYYPIEKYFSRYTDVLITINKEDYERASKKFHAKKTAYIPGVGVDTKRFAPREDGRNKIRTELGLRDDEIMILSVGELLKFENCISIINAMVGKDIVYVIVGNVENKELLEKLAVENEVNLRIKSLPNDISDYYDAADVYVSFSLCKKNNVPLLEAMARGVAVVCNQNTYGNINSINAQLFNTTNTESIRHAIETAIENRLELGKENIEKICSLNLYEIENLKSEINSYGYKHLLKLLKRQEKRAEIGVPVNAKLLISVGELSVRKNHKVIVSALQKLNSNYWYVIVGKGDLKDELESADQTGRLKLLGFRTDIVDLLHCSDLFVFPSLQEGLPVALMEAMAAGLPCVASDIRGNSDLLDKEFLCDCNDVDGFTKAIEMMSNRTSNNDVGLHNVETIEKYNANCVNSYMKNIYETLD